MDGASIVLKKYQPACIFCDAKDVINFKGKNVCPNCIRELMEKVTPLFEAAKNRGRINGPGFCGFTLCTGE